jgi:hypothetical protein
MEGKKQGGDPSGEGETSSVVEDEKDTIPPAPPSPKTKTDGMDLLDTPFPPEELPEDVLRRLEDAGVIQPTSRRVPSPPPQKSDAQSTPGTADEPASQPPATPLKSQSGTQPYSYVAKPSPPPPKPSPAPAKRPSPPPQNQAAAAPQQRPSPPQQKEAPSPPKPPPVPRKTDPKQEEYKVKLQPLVPNLQKLFRLISGGSILPGNVSYENVRFDASGVISIGHLEIGQVFEGKDGEGTSVRIFFSKINIMGDVPGLIKKKFPVSEGILALNKTKPKFFIITEKEISLGIAKSEQDSPFLYVVGNL